MELIDEFLDFEENNRLFERNINGYFYWHFIRFQVYQAIQVEKEHIESSNPVWRKKGIGRKAACLIKNLVNGLQKNPYHFKRDCSILVMNHERRMYVDGLYKPIYVEEILKGREDFMLLEPLNIYEEHYTPISYEKNTFYTDLMESIVSIHCNLHSHKNILVEKELDELFDKINNIFQIKLKTDNLKKDVFREILAYPVKRKYFETLLSKIKPKVILEVVSYNRNNMIMNEVAKKIGIPTIELQHGTMGRYHIAYNYKEKKDFSYLPDKILLFSEYWKSATRLPLKDNDLIVTGFPYLETMVSKYKRPIRNDQMKILFISQKTIGKFLSRFAIDLKNYFEGKKLDFKILYKLHPAECPSWEMDLPELYKERENIEIISDASKSIYELFGSCTMQVGVYSTAIFEGLAFELETYIVKFPGHEYMKDLYEQGYAKLINKPDEISWKREKIDGSIFWKNNSCENILKNIKEISHNLSERNV